MKIFAVLRSRSSLSFLCLTAPFVQAAGISRVGYGITASGSSAHCGVFDAYTNGKSNIWTAAAGFTSIVAGGAGEGIACASANNTRISPACGSDGLSYAC